MEKKLFSLILFLFLFSSPVLAQDFLTNIFSVISSFFQKEENIKGVIGAIFILVFILILLALGGILPKLRGGFPIGLIAFLVLIVLLFVIPYFVKFPQYLEVPPSFQQWEFPEPAKDALQLIGLPRDWGYVPAIIYLFILPFAAIYTLVWAFLASLGIFPQANVNRILAFIIAFLTIPIGWFTQMVWVLFSFLGAWSVAVFAATFILGIFFRGAGMAVKEHAEYRKYIQMGKKGLGEVVRRLEEARKGTVGQMRQEARNAIAAAPALNIGARALQNLEMAANPQTPENEVSKYVDEAIKELKKEL